MSENKMNYKLQANNGRVIEASREVISQSKVLDEMVKKLGLDAPDVAPEKRKEPIPVNKADEATLKRVIEWCEYHKNDKVEEKKDNNLFEPPKIELTEWDKQFLRNGGNQALFDIITVASFLDIERLSEMGLKLVAEMLEGKTPEEIRLEFDLPDDLTDEDKERIRKENDWVFDQPAEAPTLASTAASETSDGAQNDNHPSA